MTEVIVPDASVILKWVLRDDDEDDQENALKLRNLAIEGKVILKVPSLWLYEVGNTLSRNFPKQSRELLDALIAFKLEEAVWNEQWLNRCLFITQTYRVTFYDAAYHSLALVEKGTFITADKQYVKKTKAVGSVSTIDQWT
jgi:predicted nucleic acid-binding protein